MYTRWTNKLPKQDVEGFKLQVSGAKQVLERLAEMIEEEVELSLKSQLEKDYSSASWAYSQADSIGEQRAYQKVLKLVNNAIGKE